MAGLGDPYNVGQLIGGAFGAGAIGYVIGRVVFPRKRTAQIARLMANAGVTDEEAGSKPPGFQPHPVLVAFVFACAGLVFTAAQIVGEGFSVKDLPELRAGFVKGCSERCVKDGAGGTICSQLCQCARVELEASLQGDAEVAAWYSAASKMDQAALDKLSAAQGRCIKNAVPAP